MSKRIDPLDIRRAVKNKEIEFYAHDNNIYVRALPIDGEVFIVGHVYREYNQTSKPTSNSDLFTKIKNGEKVTMDDVMRDDNGLCYEDGKKIESH